MLLGCVTMQWAILLCAHAHAAESLCSISFAADSKYPARVEDSAAACLERAAKALRASGGGRLVIVGMADQKADHVDGNGTARMDEDTTGEDLRFWDLPSYRAINTKAYLVRWMHLPAARIVPVTSLEPTQAAKIYLLPASVEWKAAFPKAVGIFEYPCTNKPCARPEEEKMTAQQREMIPATTKN
jgi:hypothetical protein